MYASAHGTPSPRPLPERLLIRRREYSRPRLWLAVRLAAGTWNLFLGILLLSFGYWPGLIPLLAAPVIFWAAHRIWTRTRTQV